MTVVAAAVLGLNVALVFATVGGAASPDDPAPTFTTPTDAATAQDTGLVNPWAAGDAAVLQVLAESGHASLNSCL